MISSLVRNRDKKGALTGVSAALLPGQIIISKLSIVCLKKIFDKFSASYPELRISGSDIFLLDIRHI